jgi:hypothetical protein
MGVKLRSALPEVKQRPQHLVVRCTRTTTFRASCCISNVLHGCVGYGEIVLFRRGSAAYPRDSHRISAGFCTGVFSRIPQQIRRFSIGFAHDSRGHYQQIASADFHQLFRFFSSWKKREKGRKASGMEFLRKRGF